MLGRFCKRSLHKQGSFTEETRKLESLQFIATSYDWQCVAVACCSSVLQWCVAVVCCIAAGPRLRHTTATATHHCNCITPLQLYGVATMREPSKLQGGKNAGDTGWRRPIGCLKSQVIFCKRATHYRALLRKTTYEDKACSESTPPCTLSCTSLSATAPPITGLFLRKETYKSKASYASSPPYIRYVPENPTIKTIMSEVAGLFPQKIH